MPFCNHLALHCTNTSVINFPLTLFPVSVWSGDHVATRQHELLDWLPK